MTQAYHGTYDQPDWWGMSQTPGLVNQSDPVKPSYAPSSIGRNIAFAGQGLQALGALGETLYGGRVARRQAEENRKATARANLMSMLSGGNVLPTPKAVDSSGVTGSKFVSVLGRALSGAGDTYQTFAESQAKYKNAEDLALARAKQLRLSEAVHAQDVHKTAVAEAQASGQAHAQEAIRKIQLDITPETVAGQGNTLLGSLPTEGRRQAFVYNLTPLAMEGIFSVESEFVTEEGGDPYKARGPVIQSGMYKGQRALGKFQVMPGNLSEWSKELLGYEITAEEFIDRPDLQDQLAYRKIQQYVQDNVDEYVDDPVQLIQRVASKWHSGEYDTYEKEGQANDTQRDAAGNVIFAGTDTSDYSERVIESVRDRLNNLDEGGHLRLLSDEYMERRAEHQAALKMDTSAAVQDLIRNGEVSAEMSDYFTLGMESKIGQLTNQLANESVALEKTYLDELERRNELNYKRDALSARNQATADVAAHNNRELATKLAQEQQDLYDKYSQEFADSDWNKGYSKFNEQYNKFLGVYATIVEGNKGDPNVRRTGVEDITLINTFQRLIDEATVREGDVALYQTYTPALIEKLYLSLTRTLQEGGLIKDDVMSQMMGMANALRTGMQAGLESHVKDFLDSKVGMGTEMRAILDRKSSPEITKTYTRALAENVMGMVYEDFDEYLGTYAEYLETNKTLKAAPTIPVEVIRANRVGLESWNKTLGQQATDPIISAMREEQLKIHFDYEDSLKESSGINRNVLDNYGTYRQIATDVQGGQILNSGDRLVQLSRQTKAERFAQNRVDAITRGELPTDSLTSTARNLLNAFSIYRNTAAGQRLGAAFTAPGVGFRQDPLLPWIEHNND